MNTSKQKSLEVVRFDAASMFQTCSNAPLNSDVSVQSVQLEQDITVRHPFLVSQFYWGTARSISESRVFRGAEEEPSAAGQTKGPRLTLLYS
jgi:hypothetical protein